LTREHAVARAMAGFLEQTTVSLDSMLLLGDNFYGPAKDGFSVDSERWRTTFEEVYSPQVFDCPCHVVLGNHDYGDNRGGEQVQLAYARRGGTRWRMPAKWYRVDVGGDPARLTLLALDSNLRRGKEADAQMEWLVRSAVPAARARGAPRRSTAWGGTECCARSPGSTPIQTAATGFT
jgi:hypothetical protein